MKTQASAQSHLQELFFGNSSENLHKNILKFSTPVYFCLIFLLLTKYFVLDCTLNQIVSQQTLLKIINNVTDFFDAKKIGNIFKKNFTC